MDEGENEKGMSEKRREREERKRGESRSIPRTSQSAQIRLPTSFLRILRATLSVFDFSLSKLELLRLLEIEFCIAFTHLSLSCAVSAWNICF